MSQNTIFIPENATCEDLLNGAVDCLDEVVLIMEVNYFCYYSQSSKESILSIRDRILNFLEEELFG